MAHGGLVVRQFGSAITIDPTHLHQMAGLDSLQAWVLGKDVAVKVLRISAKPPLRYQRVLADQIRRAAMSIPANVAEGYALGTRAQFVRGLRIAFGSCEELRTHLEIALAVPAVADVEEMERLIQDVRRLNGILVGLLKRYGARPPTR